MNGSLKKIIAIASKALSPAQQRYAITKKELFAVVYALNKFNNYIYGRKFLLQTDHQSLLAIFNGRRENKVLNNWLHLVINYDFDIEHIKGIHHVFPDLLSRLHGMNEETVDRKWKTSSRYDSGGPELDHKSLLGTGSINLMHQGDSEPMSDDSMQNLSGDELADLASKIPD